LVVVECYKDKELMHRLGIPGHQVIHEFGRSRVLGRVRRISGSIGIIDEDPDAGQPRELMEYEQRDMTGSITLLVRRDDDSKRLMRISPRLEDWLYAVARRCKVSPERYGLSADPQALHVLPLKGDKGFREFLIDLNRASDDELTKLKEWVREMNP
jgi:hypothetical protein